MVALRLIATRKFRGRVMSKAWKLIEKLRRDEDGAALIEYTVLLGILLVAVVATIGSVGAWVNGQMGGVEHRDQSLIGGVAERRGGH